MDMIVLIVIAAILLVMGIIILIGKGDNLIAGYNTASEEERSQYNIKRLRGLTGGLSLALAPMMFLLWKETLAAVMFFLSFSFVGSIVVVVLVNTWAKKKK